MLDRVGAVLIALILLLFSVSTALACNECARETAQCLVALEGQAEEVLSADLEVASGICVLNETYPHADAPQVSGHLADYVIGSAQDCAIQPAFKASGAAGVQYIEYLELVRPYEAIDATWRQVRTGRFSGATA